jgi:hypothetical protein
VKNALQNGEEVERQKVEQREVSESSKEAVVE